MINELVDWLVQQHKHKHSNDMEREKKDMVANIHTISPPRHT